MDDLCERGCGVLREVAARVSRARRFVNLASVNSVNRYWYWLVPSVIVRTVTMYGTGYGCTYCTIDTMVEL